MPNWLATTIGVIAGGVLTMLSAWLADRRLMLRDREKRREERHERLVTRRNDFQRETLLALQNASQKLIRNAGAALVADTLAFRAGGSWRAQKLPDDLDSDILRQMTETLLLASRIRNDDVRDLADRLRRHVGEITFASDQNHAENRMAAATETHSQLIARIGQILRELDDVQ